MTNEEVKQAIIDRIGELAKDADAFTLTSLTSTLGLILNLENNADKMFANSPSSLGLLTGLTMGAMNGFSKRGEDND